MMLTDTPSACPASDTGDCCERTCHDRAVWAVTDPDGLVHGVCVRHLPFPGLVEVTPWAATTTLEAAR